LLGRIELCLLLSFVSRFFPLLFFTRRGLWLAGILLILFSSWLFGRPRDWVALFTVDTFDNLLRSGRVSRGRAWLGGLLDIKPILEVDPDGRVQPLDRVRGRDALLPRVLQHLDRRLTPRPQSLRLAVAHAGVPELAESIRTELIARYAPRECFLSSVTAALGVHTGPGAWGVFYQVED